MLIKKIVFFLLILFSVAALPVNANEANAGISQSEDCGLTDTGVVKPLSGEICPEDKAFRFFYKLFPDVLDKTVLKIIDPGYLGEVKDLESDRIEIYRGYQYALIYSINTMVDLAFFILGFFILYYTLITLLRSMESGSFLGEDWSFGSIIKKYGFLAVLLIPTGSGLVVGQFLVFIIIIAAIYLANYLWGAYLSFLEVGNDPVNLAGFAQEKYTSSERNKEYLVEAISSGGTADYNASYFTNKIIDISLCKRRTENYLINTNISQIEEFGIEQFAQCTVKDTLNAQLSNLSSSGGSNFVDEDSFYDYNLKKVNILQTGNSKYYKTDKIFMGSKVQNDSICQNFDFEIDYECGSIEMLLPDVDSHVVKETVEEINFYEKYSGVARNLSNSFDRDDLMSIIMEGWSGIYNDLVAYYTDDQTEKMTTSDEEDIKVVSYIYHQLIMNDLISGLVAMDGSQLGMLTRRVGLDRAMSAGVLNVEDYSSPILLTSKFDNGLKIADNVMELVCTENQELYKKGKRLAEKIQDGDSLSGDISAACLKMDRAGNVSNYGTEIDYEGSASDVQDALETVKVSLKEDTDLEYEELEENMRSIFISVEYSLFKSMSPLDSTSLVHRLRKEGFFSLGSYIFKISKEKEIEHKLMAALRNSFTVNTSFNNAAYIGNVNSDIAGEKATESNDINEIHSQKQFLVPERDLDFTPNVNGANYINDYLSDRIQNKDTTYSTFDVTSIVNIMGNPFASFKQSLGYNNNTDFSVEGLMECTEDTSKCAIPMENPLIGISDFGNQLIEMSIVIFAASIAVEFAAHVSSVKMLGNTGKLTDGAKKGVADEGFGAITTAAAGLIDFISVIMSFLVGFAGAMLLLGVVLAYVIPLVPFLAFTFSFIAWLVFCLQVIFLFPLWCVFSMRVASEQDTNSDMYRAAYNLMMQILFKPIVVVGVYLLMWSILAVMVAVVNYTIVSYMSSSLEANSFFLMELVSSLVLLVVYAILIFSIVKMLFNTLHSMTKKIFDYLKVESASDANAIKPEDAFNKAISSGVVASSLTQFGGRRQQSMAQSASKREQRKRNANDPTVMKEAKRKISQYNDVQSSAEDNKKGNKD